MACKPHAGHFALAKLQEKYNVVHITQNIDSLLEQAGATNVKHLHGRIDRQKCEWHNEITILDGDVRFGCNYKTISKEPPKLGDLCPHCQGQMRPDVVWFNEAVDFSFDDMRELCKEVKYNDGVFICVGTSAEVYPAAYLVSFFAQVKNKFIVDPAPKKVADYELLEGTAAAKLPELVERLLDEKLDKDMAVNSI